MPQSCVFEGGGDDVLAYVELRRVRSTVRTNDAELPSLVSTDLFCVDCATAAFSHALVCPACEVRTRRLSRLGRVSNSNLSNVDRRQFNST